MFAHRSRRRGFTLIELFVVIAIVAILIAFLLPSVRMPREAARRSQCKNNMKQIALALHTYHDVHGSFPPVFTVGTDGKPLHSWRTLILPYLEEQALYDKIDLSKPWDDPANKIAFDSVIPSYLCPSATCPPNHSVYLAVATPDGCFAPGTYRRLSEITDGTSNTLLLIEIDTDRSVPWMQPIDADESLVMSMRPEGKLSHEGGIHVGLVDGSVRFLSADTSAEDRLALITVSAGDSVSEQ